MSHAICVSASGSATIAPRMLREAVAQEIKRQKLPLLTVSKGADVSYGRLHEWIHGTRPMHSDSVESVMKFLGLRVCRPPSRPPRRKGKAK